MKRPLNILADTRELSAVRFDCYGMFHVEHSVFCRILSENSNYKGFMKIPAESGNKAIANVYSLEIRLTFRPENDII